MRFNVGKHAFFVRPEPLIGISVGIDAKIRTQNGFIRTDCAQERTNKNVYLDLNDLYKYYLMLFCSRALFLFTRALARLFSFCGSFSWSERKKKKIVLFLCVFILIFGVCVCVTLRESLFFRIIQMSTGLLMLYIFLLFLRVHTCSPEEKK